jgi:GDP-L-fucose synthase
MLERRILVTGAHGFLGSSVCRLLREQGYTRLLTPTRRECDLTVETDVARLFTDLRPEVVLHLAGEVGGIGQQRDRPADFAYRNLVMGLHLIEHARRANVSAFVQVGSLCSYPARAPIPSREDDLWTGYPDDTTAPYGVAKLTLLTLLRAYHRQYGLRSAYLLPCNLYGPGDRFDPSAGNVVPALIRKFLDARDTDAPTVTAWGTGNATREFLYVDDCAEAIVLAMEHAVEPVPINVGTGIERSVRELTELVADLTGFRGEVLWDTSKPDGAPRRCVDVSRARDRFGFLARVELKDGLTRTIAWYESHRRAGSV